MYLEIKNLSKKIGDAVILDEISLNMDAGKIYGFKGKNGSGKTMLMRAICGLISPDQGEIIIGGRKVDRDKDCFHDIGVLIESPGFIEHYDAYDNLKAIASIQGKISSDRIKQILTLVQLNYESKKKVKKFSLGMRQKLGIAIALMENPRMIILDEPFNALDQEGAKAIRDLIIRYKKSGSLIIISSHDRESLEGLSDEIFLLEHGKIIDHYDFSKGEGN